MRSALLRISLSGALLGSLVLVVAPSVVAQDAASVEGEPSPAYRALIEGAVQEFAAGNFAEARALFRRAHAISPNARTSRGMGMSAFELRDYAEAVHLLGEALLDVRQPLTDEQRGQVTALLARAEAFVARFTVLADEGATVAIDGVPASLEPDGTLLVGLGHHELTTSRDGSIRGRATVEVEGGEARTIDLRGAPVEAVAPPVVPAPAPPPTVRDDAPALALVITGGVVALGGAVMLGVGVADRDGVANAPPGTAWSAVEDAHGRAPVLQGVGVATLLVGAAAATIGVVLLATAPASSGTVAVRAGPTGIAIEGTF
jgi:hypothetical protein